MLKLPLFLLGFFFFREMKMYTTDVWENTNTYLVYEHAENGSLTDWLHDKKYPGYVEWSGGVKSGFLKIIPTCLAHEESSIRISR
jgi:hypothetical protein